MGLIDFVKDAGEKLFKRGPSDEDIARAKAELARANAERAAELEGVVSKMGFDISTLDVAYDDSVARLTGSVSSQADREKIVLLVGNVAGIGQVDDQLRVEKPEPEAVMYTVKSGDSLSKIAAAHYGSASKYPVIFEANKPMLSDPNKIYPGQVLRIPPIEG